MILFSVVVLLVLIYLFFKRKFTFWENHGVVFVPATFPYGSFNGFQRKEHYSIIIKRLYDEYKEKNSLVGLYFMVQPIIMPLDPEIIKDVFTRHFDNFHDRGFYYDEKDDPLSAHLFALSGEKWKEVRTKLTPTFTSGRIKMMFSTVSSECDKMTSYLDPIVDRGENIEMKEVFAAFTTQVIASVAFGLETQCLGNPNNEFRHVAKRFLEPTNIDNLKFLVLSSYPNIGKKLKLRMSDPKASKFFLDLIDNTVKYRETNNIQRNDFLQLLIEIKNSEKGMSIAEMAANSFLFFLAGFETSSSVATFAVHELALNPDIQERLRNEISEILSKYDDKVTYDGIMEMKYLDMVFKETLRKYPVVPTQFRKSTKDYAVPNTNMVIPAGTAVFVPIAALHNDERFYENPSKFDPERFTPENEKKIPSYAYLPFSEGPRICIGQRFGTMQTKLALISLLRKYEILPCEKTLIPMRLAPRAAFQSPDGGMWLKFKKV